MSRRSEAGGAALEMALVTPLLMLFLAGVVDLGMALVLRAQMQEGVQEGVSFAARNPGDPAQARTRAIDAVSLVEIDPDSVAINCVNDSGTPQVRMTISHDHEVLFGFALPDEIQVRVAMVTNVISTEDCSES